MRGGHNKRSSERDVALVQMQIAAQARNRRWHEFLCEKRDELQARLRQQGYSQRWQREQSEQRESPLAGGYEPGPDGPDVEALRGAGSQTSTRWGIAMSDGDNGGQGDRGADIQPESQLTNAEEQADPAILGGEPAGWWEESDGDPSHDAWSGAEAEKGIASDR